MGILIKLISAVLIGIAMLLAVMLLLVAGGFFVGFIASLFGFETLAQAATDFHKTMWKRTKRWFFRYKGD